jgi:PAS domain S-box-containing protein
MTDQAEQRHRDAALQESEARFRAIFDAAAIGIALVDLKGHLTESNPALQRLLGYSAEELCALHFADLTHPEDVAADLALARELFAGTRDTYQIEKRYVRKDGTVIWGHLTASLVRDAAGAPRYAIGMIQDITERVQLASRREGLLRVARRLGLETDPAHLLQLLVAEAVALTVGTTGVVARWDDRQQRLVSITPPFAQAVSPVDLELGQGAGGQAAARRVPVIYNDYPQRAEAVPAVVQAGVQAVVAAPLLHEQRLLGVVAIASTEPGKQFTQLDADVLELLASMAATALVTVERARLAGALLAARTAQHALNNQLSTVVGYADLLTEDPRLLEDLRLLAQETRTGAQEAARTLQELGRITRLEEVDQGGPGPVLDLARSTAPGSASGVDA